MSMLNTAISHLLTTVSNELSALAIELSQCSWTWSGAAGTVTETQRMQAQQQLQVVAGAATDAAYRVREYEARQAEELIAALGGAL